VVRDRRITTVDYSALVEDAADPTDAVRGAYRGHFERMAPVIAFIADSARKQSARPLPYVRWASAGDDL